MAGNLSDYIVTVMLVDEQRTVARGIQSMLREHPDIDFIWCADEREAEKMACQHGPSVILQDINMPYLDGFELLSRYRNNDVIKDIPIIMLSGEQAAETKARSFLEGASDYLTKPPHPIELVARIRHHSRAYFEHLEREELLQSLEAKTRELTELTRRLEQLSLTDALTGIPNRMHFDQILDREWGRARRDRKPLSVALMDVDNFKQFNDFYGHQAGDDCLRRVARAVAESLRRPSDFAARYGGEEFALVLPDTDAEGARKVAELARAAVAELAIPHERAEAALHVTISIGVASTIPGQDDVARDELVKRADEALYESKSNGRNQVTVKE